MTIDAHQLIANQASRDGEDCPVETVETTGDRPCNLALNREEDEITEVVACRRLGVDEFFHDAFVADREFAAGAVFEQFGEKASGKYFRVFLEETLDRSGSATFLSKFMSI